MINSRKLTDLRPAAKRRAQAFKKLCMKTYGIDVLIYCTYRDEAMQNKLYQKGRSTPGKRVTNARGGKSWHQYRVAWDCVPLEDGKAMWGDKGAYAKMGKIAKMLGIEWAGNWKSFKEKAHFQYNKGLTMQHFKDGGSL